MRKMPPEGEEEKFRALTDQQYIFAIDRTKRPTQKRLVRHISQGMGTSAMDRDVVEEADWSSWSKFLTINLRMKTSDVFKDAELTTEEEKLEEEDQAAKLEEAKFPWHSEQGIVENISKLNEEFNDFRGLNPVKIFVTGPPASGKTFYSEKLASYYHIPRVHV